MPTTLDEAITRDAVTGRLRGEAPPELIVCVLDSTNLRLSLRLALELTRLSIPMVVALNMSDLAERRGFKFDRDALARELGVPVVETVAVRAGGEAALLAALDELHAGAPRERAFDLPPDSDAELDRDPARGAAHSGRDSTTSNRCAIARWRVSMRGHESGRRARCCSRCCCS